jgi:hypothetical protein
MAIQEPLPDGFATRCIDSMPNRTARVARPSIKIRNRNRRFRTNPCTSCRHCAVSRSDGKAGDADFDGRQSNPAACGRIANASILRAWNAFPFGKDSRYQRSARVSLNLVERRSQTAVSSGAPKWLANSAAANLPLAARPCVGHIRPDGAVAEWLKAAVC